MHFCYFLIHNFGVGWNYWHKAKCRSIKTTCYHIYTCLQNRREGERRNVSPPQIGEIVLESRGYLPKEREIQEYLVKMQKRQFSKEILIRNLNFVENFQNILIFGPNVQILHAFFDVSFLMEYTREMLVIFHFSTISVGKNV